MARPTKLTPELMEQARKHVDEFDNSLATLLPTVEGLALELHISRETVYAWAKENDTFSDIVNDLKAKQAQKLIQNTVINRYNPTIAKLILSGKHGYVEKSEVDNKHEIVKPIFGGMSIEASSDVKAIEEDVPGSNSDS